MALTVHSIWGDIRKGRDKWAALGRDVNGNALVMEKLRLKTLCKLLKRKKDPDSQWVVVVITGDARGADTAAAEFAQRQRLGLVRFTPAWACFRYNAGHIHNDWMIGMLNEGAQAVAFWDGESSGTKDSITRLRRRGIEPRLINPLELDR